MPGLHVGRGRGRSSPPAPLRAGEGAGAEDRYDFRDAASAALMSSCSSGVYWGPIG